MNKAIDLARDAITALLEGDSSEQRLEGLVTELEQLVQEEQIILSVRDQFAMRAMQGFAADPDNCMTSEQNARLAYQWADAMMDAREE